jgi:hypothetical protein
MLLHRCLRVFALLGTLPGLASLAGAQYQYDVIGFQRIQIDDATQGVSAGWLVLVNTGTVPIPLVEWSDALHYAELDAAVGSFDIEPVFAGPTTLAPGEAIGAFDPVLTSQLRVGESFVNAASTRFQLFRPWPSGTTKNLRWSFVLGDRQVSGVTEVEFTPTPSAFGVSAFRTSAVPATAQVGILSSGCAGTIRVRAQAEPSPFRIAPSSDLPVIGNRCFGLDVRVSNAPYLLGVDLAPGSGQFLGCDRRVGLSPSFFAVPYPGNIAVRLPIPNQVAMIGRFYLQVAPVGSGGTLTGLTNGLELLIGPKP